MHTPNLGEDLFEPLLSRAVLAWRARALSRKGYATVKERRTKMTLDACRRARQALGNGVSGQNCSDGFVRRAFGWSHPLGV